MTEEDEFVAAADDQHKRSIGKVVALLRALNFFLQANICAKETKIEANNRTIAFNKNKIELLQGNTRPESDTEQAHEGGAQVELMRSLDNLEDSLDSLGTDPPSYFVSLLFVDLISETELYFSSLIRIVIHKHPKKIGGAQFKLSDILESSSKDELVVRAAEDFLHDLFYKKPNEYLNEICSLLSIDRLAMAPHWNTYVEAKARRDLGVHNNWKCNKTYLRKLFEAGIKSDCSVGQPLSPTQDYFNAVVSSVSKMLRAMHSAVVGKHALNPQAQERGAPD